MRDSKLHQSRRKDAEKSDQLPVHHKWATCLLPGVPRCASDEFHRDSFFGDWKTLSETIRSRVCSSDHDNTNNEKGAFRKQSQGFDEVVESCDGSAGGFSHNPKCISCLPKHFVLQSLEGPGNQLTDISSALPWWNFPGVCIHIFVDTHLLIAIQACREGASHGYA